MCRRNDTRINLWSEKYNRNKTSIETLFKYIKENLKIYDKFNDISIDQLVKRARNNKEIIYYCFLDSINTSSRTKIDNLLISLKLFLEKLDSYNFNDKIDFENFIKHFDKNNDSINSFFKYIVKTFPGIGQKIASVFIRELHLVNDKYEIFDNFDYPAFDYKIALDIVIEDVFNQMLGFESRNEMRYNRKGEEVEMMKQELIDRTKDFDNFHKFINKIGLEQEAVESLWFWGYFNTKSNGDEFRDISFNEGKYFTNQFFYPGDGNLFKEELEGFSTLFNKLWKR